MKKILSTLVFLVCCTTAYSQPKGIKCTYVTSFDYLGNNEKLANSINKDKKIFTVQYYNGEYLCQLTEDNKEIAITGCHNSDYIKDSIYCRQLDFEKSIYLIEDKMKPLNWNITQETRTINGRLCTKATLTVASISKKGKYNEVVAWFTTDVPFTFGPVGYCGLPGAIIYLKTPEINYTLKDFAYTDDIKIEKPTEGKKISEHDFNEMVRKQWEEWERMAKEQAVKQ